MPEHRKTRLPGLADTPALLLPALKEIVEVLTGRRGDPKDRAVTHRELEAALKVSAESVAAGKATAEQVLGLLRGKIGPEHLTDDLAETLGVAVEDEGP